MFDLALGRCSIFPHPGLVFEICSTDSVHADREPVMVESMLITKRDIYFTDI